MEPEFSGKPGRRERHLQRKYQNVLFPQKERDVSQDQVATVRSLDEGELLQFLQDFQAVLKEIVELAPNVESEVILDIKKRLDQLYEQVCGLGGNRSAEKAGLVKLHLAVDQAIAVGAAGDATAEERLAQEAEARSVHWQLLEEPMVADLLAPDSPIKESELLPSLLSQDAAAFGMTMGMFDAEQRRSLLTQAEALLKDREDEPGLENPRARVEFLQGMLFSTEERE